MVDRAADTVKLPEGRRQGRVTVELSTLHQRLVGTGFDRKELVLRLRSSTLVVLVSAVLLGGCHARSFFDQTELGRFPRAPLLVPILNNLDTGYEEGDERFATATGVRPQDLVAVSADYVINRNDFLLVSITDLLGPGIESFKQVRVSESGNISLPYIRQIRAAGLTEAQLEEAIAVAYADMNLIQRAQVSVTVQEARGRTFTITGAVPQPGQYAIYDSNFRVLDALALARGITSQGIDNIYIVRRLEQEPDALEQAPELMPGPPTQPAPDVLTPESRLIPQHGPDHAIVEQPGRRVTMLTTQMQPSMELQPPPPADEPPPAEREGRIIIIDGKEVRVQEGGVVEDITPPPAEEPMEFEVRRAEPDFEFRELDEPGDLRVIRVPYEALQRGELRYNVVIRPQDMIIVPDPVIGEYYMGGHVQRTGVYSLSARNITLKQAVIAAGMLDQLAVPWRTQVTRRIGPDREITVSVNLTKIFAGQEPDIYLKPYDQVMVGTDVWAPFLAAARNGFRITYGFGFLYDRNYAPVRQNQ
jgi:polysaccharide biosynthesis/export protein